MGRNRSNATAPAVKGDLVAGTGVDISGVLALGSNGDTLVADSSTATGLRYTAGTVQANPVLNSAFQIWQRGTSIAIPSSTGNTFSADRWTSQTGAAAITISRQLTSDTTNLPFIQYCARYQRNSGQTGTNTIPLVQNIETLNARPFAGKAITFSFYARRGANYSPTSNALDFNVGSGTGTDQNVLTSYTGEAAVLSGTATLTTTWQRFTGTGTVSASATEMYIRFNYSPTGTAGAADFYEITGVQLDVGSVALPFRTYAGTIQGELSACQRYYYRTGVGLGDTTPAIYEPLGYGSFFNSTIFVGQCEFPVTMRIKTGSVQFSNVAINTATSAFAVTNVVVDAGGLNRSQINLTIASGGTANIFGRIQNNNSTAGYLAWSAEL